MSQRRDDNGRVLTNDQQPTTNDRPIARLHLPVWLRPPAKHQRQVFAFQFLPLYIVIAVLLFLVLSTGISYLLPAGTPRLWGALLAKAILAVAMTVPAFAISRIEGRPFGDFGLPAAYALGTLFWMGVLWGLCFLSLLLVILRVACTLSHGGVVFHV